MPILLIFIGMLLIIFSYKSIKGEQKSNSSYVEENEPFSKVLDENTINLSDYKYELGILRKNIGESITELQQDILDIKRNLDMVKDDSEFNDNYYEETNNDKIIDNDEDINSNEEQSIQNKVQSIRSLIQDGVSEDEICKILSVGKGEVLLVKELYK